MLYIIQKVLPDYRNGLWESLRNQFGGFFLVSPSESRDLPEGVRKIGGKPIAFILKLAREGRLEGNVFVVEGQITCLEFWLLAALREYFNFNLVVWTSEWEKHKGRWVLLFKRWLKVRLYRQADLFLCYSNLAASRLGDLSLPLEKISVIYNGIERQAVNATVSIPADALKFIETQRKLNKVIGVFCGRLTSFKNLELWLSSLSDTRTSEIAFLVIGDGEMREKCESVVNALRPNDVFFTGSLSLSVAETVMRQCDFGFLPGIGGLALNHYLLSEIPVLVSEADGTELDLVEHGYNGHFFKKNDKESFVEGLAKLAVASYRQVLTKGAKGWMADKGVERTGRLFAESIRHLGADGKP